ncbi:4737_t:CDS:2, partial [Racocetra fulgida]
YLPTAKAIQLFAPKNKTDDGEWICPPSTYSELNVHATTLRIVKVKDISKFGTNNAKMVPAKVVLAEIDINNIDELFEDGYFYIKNIKNEKASDIPRVRLVKETKDDATTDWLLITIGEDVYLVKHKENIDASESSLLKIICNHYHQNEDEFNYQNEIDKIKKFDKETKVYVDILQTGFLNYIVYSHRSDKEKMFDHVPNGN